MLVAELHGKITDDGRNATDRGEDVLTSNVFGSLRYLADHSSLLAWLSAAVPYQGSRPLVPEGVTSCDVRFWPKLRTREIDLCLVLRLAAGTCEVIGIECKYRSPKSGRARVPEQGEREEEDDEGRLLAPGDQLADYWDALRSDAIRPLAYRPESVRRRTLLFVTRHHVLPRRDFAQSLGLFGGAGVPSDTFYWLSWRALWPVIDGGPLAPGARGEPLLLHDLRALLVQKGFRSFSGFHAAAPVLPAVPRWRGERWSSLQAPTLPPMASFFRSTRRWALVPPVILDGTPAWRVPSPQENSA